MSYTRQAMAHLRRVIATTENPQSDDETEILRALSWNEDDVVDAEQSAWLAARLANADRRRIKAEEPAPDELLHLIDELHAFCLRCSKREGFVIS